MDGVFDCPFAAVELLVLSKLLLFGLELGEPLLDVRQHLLNALLLRLRVFEDLAALRPAVVVGLGAGNFFEQAEPVAVPHCSQLHNSPLLHSVVWVRARESAALEQVHYLSFRNVL